MEKEIKKVVSKPGLETLKNKRIDEDAWRRATILDKPGVDALKGKKGEEDTWRRATIAP